MKSKLLVLLFVFVLANSQGSGCLTPEQKGNLTEAVSIIDHTLDVVEVGLRIAAFLEKNATVKNQLLEAEHIIKIVQVEIVNNLTKICEETCGTCKDITDAVGDMLKTLEDALTQIEPDWQNNPLYKAIVEAVNDIVKLVEAICPSSAKYFIRQYPILLERLVIPFHHTKKAPKQRCEECVESLAALHKSASLTRCPFQRMEIYGEAILAKMHSCERQCEVAEISL